MLTVVGAESLESLFSGIQEECRRLREMNLPEALSEWVLNRHMDDLSAGLAVSPRSKIYIGAGRYDHRIPATVSSLKSRSEFLPIRPTNRKSVREPFRPFTNTRLLLQGSWARILQPYPFNLPIFSGVSKI